jgi:hypothetical protein
MKMDDEVVGQELPNARLVEPDVDAALATARRGLQAPAPSASTVPFPENAARRQETDRNGAHEPTHIRDLLPDPTNRRRHAPRNVGLIVDALHTVGAARSIVIDEQNVVLAGNATIDAAAEAGIEKVRVVEASGDEIIAVRRRDLTDEQKRQLAMFDNRSAELADWDVEQLKADVGAGLDLGAFFEPAELADLLGAAAPIPEFQSASEIEQGRLDQIAPVVCPNCGHEFHR